MTHSKTISVIMGPTGTGKSACALAIAARRPTVIINADAMQMVADLCIITARPTPAEEAQAQHALYGVLDAAQPTSVARWLAMVVPVIARAWAEGKSPLLVGGTGMYIKALREGLASMPPIPDEVRARVRTMDATALHAALQAADPMGAAQLKPGDTQRLARALEIVEATGVPMHAWQQQKSTPAFADATYQTYALVMPRAALYARLNARFSDMIAAGALAEVQALMARPLPADTPVLRAHGVPELMAHLRGEMTLNAAIAKAQQNTRNYAKRQMTWLRQQAHDAILLDAAQPDMTAIL